MEKRKRPPLPLDASPQEKYDNLILTFFEEWQSFSGELIDLEIFSEVKNFIHLGFANRTEFELYLNTVISDDLFKTSREPYKGAQTLLSLTFKGLNYCHSLLESGKNSTRCFVAMKFSDDMVKFYEEGIAKAIEDNSFRPIRVDREHAENEQTINDFIIASIKQSRFCVADLTHKSHGAYFEAGYALGRGLKVIYTCRADHFEEVHFDLKNMQIIKYATPEELREALSLKIQAVILE
ncbi:MAG: hypothetical protein OHK0019_28000 [Saprospiraceae bacterium]